MSLPLTGTHIEIGHTYSILGTVTIFVIVKSILFVFPTMTFNYYYQLLSERVRDLRIGNKI